MTTSQRPLNVRRFAPGEFVFQEGDSAEYAYVIESGSIEICKLTAGHYERLVVWKAGGLFGEMALLDNEPRSAAARAVTDAVVREIDEKAFMAYIIRAPNVAIDMMKRLTSYVRSLNKRLEKSVFDTSEKSPSVSVHTSPSKSSGPDRTSGESPTPPTMKVEKRDFHGNRGETASVINAFQSPCREIETRVLPPIIKITFFSILAFVAAFLLWASLSIIDTTVSARGKLTTTVPKITVQSGDSSVVRSVHVAPGQRVREGDVLAQLDPTFTEADLNRMTLEHDRLVAKIERLEFEIQEDQRDQEDGNHSHALSDEIQRTILINRLQEYDARLDSMDQAIQNTKNKILITQEDIEFSEQQFQVLKKMEITREEAWQRHQTSRDHYFSYLNARNARLSAQREKKGLLDAIQTMQGDLAVKKADRQAFVSEWFSSIAKELSQSTEQRDSKREELIKLRRRQENIHILAPADGVVLELEKLFVGAIVREADVVLTLVPTDVPLTVELDIDPKEISQLMLNQKLSIKLDALPFQKHGDLNGSLNFISEDTVENSINEEPGTFYRARARITENNLKETPPNFRLVPGMQLSGDIRVGRRRLITYFIYPIMRTIQTSFTEPGR